MPSTKQMKILYQTGIITAFAVLAFVSTTAIRIPIPASGGYFNIGDTFVMAAALLFGPVAGALVGLIGPTMADVVGFPMFVLATGITKLVEGLVVGVVGGGNRASTVRVVFSLFCGTVVLVGGYYCFEAYVYPALAQHLPAFAVTDPNAAIGELLPNTLQGVFSGVLAFGIWWMFRGTTSDGLD